VGWAALWTWQDRQSERRPPREARHDPLPPPDDRIEFQGVVDKVSLSPRENPAYKLLVDRVRETPPATLSAESRHDLVFSQFLDNPRRYRGLPVHIDGMARRIVEQSAEGTAVWPKRDYYEAFLFTGDSQGYPWWVAFEEAPEGLPLGDNVFQPVAFDGYFLKLMGYRAGDAVRFAPFLIGRIRPVATKEATGARSSGWPIQPWWLLALGALLVFGILRWWIFARGAFRKGTWTPRSPVPVTDRIEPEDLNAWVEQQAEAADDELFHPDDRSDDDDSEGGLLARR
jgi:hypothetical protein